MLKKIIAVLALTFCLNTKVAAKTIKVSIPSYPVTVNNVEMEKEKNNYPPLAYRGVTYFPMTWSVFHDELDYEVSFDSKNDLC